MCLGLNQTAMTVSAMNQRNGGIPWVMLGARKARNPVFHSSVGVARAFGVIGPQTGTGLSTSVEHA